MSEILTASAPKASGTPLGFLPLYAATSCPNRPAGTTLASGGFDDNLPDANLAGLADKHGLAAPLLAKDELYKLNLNLPHSR